jgi:hypothetical protein
MINTRAIRMQWEGRLEAGRAWAAPVRGERGAGRGLGRRRGSGKDHRCLAVIEPDVRIARIRLSDKSSRLHPRHVVPKPAQEYEPEMPVKVNALPPA